MWKELNPGIPLAVLLIGLLIFNNGCGQRQRQVGSRHAPEWLTNHLAKTLALSESQKAELAALQHKLLEQEETLTEMTEDLHREVLNQLKSPRFNAGTVNRQFAEKEAQFQEIRRTMVAAVADFHHQLTVDQRRELAELADNGGRRHHRWHR